MEFDQLQYFVAVAKELHFARAAARLGIAQPPLSRSIRKLEQELGVALVSRSNKWKVTLTPAGRVFLPEAEQILHRRQYAANLVHAAGAGQYGHLAIGAIASMLGKRGFINALMEMRRKYPKVSLEVMDSFSSGLPEQVRNRALELALLRPAPELYHDGELRCENICDDELLVALPHSHRLARAEEVAIGDLAGEAFIMVPERTSPVFRKFLVNFCQQAGGFSPRLAGESTSSYTALQLTAAGFGITIVSSTYANMFGESLCYRHFAAPTPLLPVAALRAADQRNPVLDNFLNILKRNLDRP